MNLSKKFTLESSVFDLTTGTDKDIICLREERYFLYIGSHYLGSVCILPMFAEDFCLGHLYSCSIINSVKDVLSIRICDSNRAYIYLSVNKVFNPNNYLYTGSTPLNWGDIISLKGDYNNIINAYKIKQGFENKINLNGALQSCFYMCLINNDSDIIETVFDFNLEACFDKLLGLRKLNLKGLAVLANGSAGLAVVERMYKAGVKAGFFTGQPTAQALMTARKAGINLFSTSESKAIIRY